MHLRQVCCVFTKQTVWTDGERYMSAVNWAKHARKQAAFLARKAG